MKQADQLRDDLRFVRGAVTRRERGGRNLWMMLVVATYVFVGYNLLDYSPPVASWFLAIAGFALWPVMSLLARRQARREGERDRTRNRLATLHWCGGIMLAVVSTMALAWVIPALRGQAGSQVLVVMIGVVYFLGGVHYDRNFLWLGPVVILGGAMVGFIPHHGWGVLGAVIAAGLLLPSLFRRHDGGDHSTAHHLEMRPI